MQNATDTQHCQHLCEEQPVLLVIFIECTAKDTILHCASTMVLFGVSSTMRRRAGPIKTLDALVEG